MRFEIFSKRFEIEENRRRRRRSKERRRQGISQVLRAETWVTVYRTIAMTRRVEVLLLLENNTEALAKLTRQGAKGFGFKCMVKINMAKRTSAKAERGVESWAKRGTS